MRLRRAGHFVSIFEVPEFFVVVGSPDMVLAQKQKYSRQIKFNSHYTSVHMNVSVNLVVLTFPEKIGLVKISSVLLCIR